jgi:hypothetical protein
MSEPTTADLLATHGGRGGPEDRSLRRDGPLPEGEPLDGEDLVLGCRCRVADLLP